LTARVLQKEQTHPHTIANIIPAAKQINGGLAFLLYNIASTVQKQQQ
jgi:hypothetical protein